MNEKESISAREMNEYYIQLSEANEWTRESRESRHEMAEGGLLWFTLFMTQFLCILVLLHLLLFCY